MKKILITGANSYIGTSFEKYIKEKYPNDYTVDTVDMTDASWREKSFAGYDSVFHVAGIAHIKESKENRNLFYKINRDLAIETAEKAKKEGARQFLYLSSLSVYGMESGVINKNTVPMPQNSYGRSKLQAEERLLPMNSEDFRVMIIRPPMVYGKDCKGNFRTVVKIVKKSPVFPKVKNKRSMIYIDTLCAYVKEYVDNRSSGVAIPQNYEYMNTGEMAEAIAERLGKKLYLSSVLGVMVKMLCPFVSVANKAFGSLIYEESRERKENEKTNRENVWESV